MPDVITKSTGALRQLAFTYARMQLLPALMTAIGEDESTRKLSKQFTSGRAVTNTSSSLVQPLGRGVKVPLEEEECVAVNSCLGDDIVTTHIKVEKSTRAEINGALYHSMNYRRATKMNYYAVECTDDDTEQYAEIRSFVRVNSVDLALVESLERTTTGLGWTYQPVKDI